MRNLIQNLHILILLASLPHLLMAGARTEAARKAYIEQHKPYALMVELKYGIPASICLAQALLETDAGRSKLNLEGNNHFGIKAGPSWNGPIMYKLDDKYDKNGTIIPSKFRVYRSTVSSYKNYGQMMSRSARYKPLLQIPTSDYASWAGGIQEKGYASNPYYAKLLIWLIEKYKLHEIQLMEVRTMPICENTQAESTRAEDPELLEPPTQPQRQREKSSLDMMSERACMSLILLLLFNLLFHWKQILWPSHDIQGQFIRGSFCLTL